jgi:hypothetical protein
MLPKNMTKNKGKVKAILTNFVRILLVLAFIGAFVKQRNLLLVFLVITFLATYTPLIMKKFFKIETRAEPQIVMLFIIYGVLFLSEVRGLFAGDWWDILLTFGASIILGFIGLTIIYVLYEEKIINTSSFMIVVLSFSLSFAIGSLWEIIEFILDTNLGFNLGQLGTGNTIKDLTIYAIGIFIVSFGGNLYMKNSKNNVLSGIIIRFMDKNPSLFKSKKHLEKQSEQIQDIIKKGEGPKLEFKSTLRTNLHTGDKDKNMELSTLKTLVAYLNSEGGTLLVGVSDSGFVLGLEKDAFENNDKLKLHLTNLIKQHIGRQFFPFIQYELCPIKDLHVLKIDCLPSDKRVFLKNGKEEEFYIRNGPSTSKLTGSALIDYINHKFRK